MRHDGLHMEWSHIWSFLHWKTTIQVKGWIMSLMDDSTQGVTWWLEMVKIARKGFEVLSKGEGQAMAWRPRNLARVKKKVLAFSWGTNQAMMVILMWRIKSLLVCLMKVTWYIWSYLYLMNGIKSRAQDGYAQKERLNLTCWHPHLMKIERNGIGLKKINSRGSNSFFI